ncbi:hypothetical protein Ddye_007769 [Dipteronia dyeriana]|uniref:MULE transposase domain-containing protein n=1 Tax=Dipteronia dyeriana TaxID=168575 RepID=A0AAD9XL25_9ROSI|nr:hypothetical protein Ddye_007769 [Dipteronia dyeriana]
MVVLLHNLSEKQTGTDKVFEDDYYIWVYLPWSSVNFSGFEQDVFGDNECDNEDQVGLGDKSGDNEDIVGLGDKSGDDTSLGMRAIFVVREILEDVCDEVSNAKLARVIKSNPFKQLVGCPIRIYKNKEARSKWMAGKFQALMISNPGIQASVIFDLLRDQFNVVVDTQRLYKTKNRVLQVLLKEHEACFQHLRPYAIMGPYEEVLLSAIALDANSGLYLLAYCIYEGETYLSCSWFLEELRVFLRYPDDKPICFMSDSQKEVIGALKMQWPRASIRYCARHIYANFRTSYGGEKLQNLFWRAAKTADMYEFRKCLAEIGCINPKAMKCLAKMEPNH